MDAWGQLKQLVAEELQLPAPSQAVTLSQEILRQRPEVSAILFYGSGLWREIEQDTVLDFYVLVDSYRDFNNKVSHAFFGQLLPPNVYYLQTSDARCKYAVMRLDQFARAAAGRGPHSQVWARFAQPCRLLYSRSVEVQHKVVEALARAVVTFHEQTLPLLDKAETAADMIWVRGFTQTYGNEWRSEGNTRAREIYNASQARFAARTPLALQLSRPDQPVITTGMRRTLSKLVHFLQLLKAVFTFEGGVDYALWKIERQSGVRLEASDFQRRHPLLSAWPLVWKAWRLGALR